VIGSFGNSGKVSTVLVDPEDMTRRPARDYDHFQRNVRALLEPTAKGKGYSTTGVDGINALYEFVQEMAGPGHALGEIVYKARRYGAKRNPEDLEKIAAWAWLAWKHHQDK
jgi:hypothetical protein